MTQLGFAAVEALSPSTDASLGQLFTPLKLAARIVEWAGVHHGMRVVEPSCGTGRFVAPLADAGAEVFAVDIDPRMVEVTARISTRAPVVTGNFLGMEVPPPDRFDLAIGNPPWDDGAYAVHVEQWLRWAPRAVALLPLACLASRDRYERLWSRHRLTRMVSFGRRPGFGGEYATGDRDVGVFELVRRLRPREPGEVDLVAVEWWDP